MLKESFHECHEAKGKMKRKFWKIRLAWLLKDLEVAKTTTDKLVRLRNPMCDCETALTYSGMRRCIITKEHEPNQGIPKPVLTLETIMAIAKEQGMF